MRKKKRQIPQKVTSKAKKGQKLLTEKQGAWKSFWDRYCQM
jgi:hypothetical protein